MTRYLKNTLYTIKCIDVARRLHFAIKFLYNIQETYFTVYT